MPKDTTLNEWFGEAMKRDAPATVAKQWYQWRCGERLSRWLNLFCECTNLQQPIDKSTRAFWKKWGGTFIEQYGSDYELTKRVIKYMDTRIPRLTISSPKSLMNVARDMKRGAKVEPDSREERDKYLKWTE